MNIFKETYRNVFQANKTTIKRKKKLENIFDSIINNIWQYKRVTTVPKLAHGETYLIQERKLYIVDILRGFDVNIQIKTKGR